MKNTKALLERANNLLKILNRGESRLSEEEVKIIELIRIGIDLDLKRAYDEDITEEVNTFYERVTNVFNNIALETKSKEYYLNTLKAMVGSGIN